MKKLNCYLFYICGTNIPCSECEEINIEIPVISLEGDTDVVGVSVTEISIKIQLSELALL